MERTKPIGRWLAAFVPSKRKMSLKQARHQSDLAVMRCALAKLDVECAVARMTMKKSWKKYIQSVNKNRGGSPKSRDEQSEIRGGLRQGSGGTN